MENVTMENVMLENVTLENIAVILAGGVGARFGGENSGGSVPKQFVKINGVDLIKITVEKFACLEEIAKIVVVVLPEWESYTKELLKSFKNVYIAFGGQTRTRSSHNALKFIHKMGWQNSFVLIHDAARPFISKADILALINAGKTCTKAYNAAVLAMPSSSTLYLAENGNVAEIIDRSKIFEAQTPQCFKFALIFECYKKIEENDNFTDDVSVVLKYSSQQIKIIIPTEKNPKITYKHDL